MGSVDYFTPVDIWSVGCIMAELLNLQALFQGDSEIDQLYKIFRTLGTPNEETWPGVTELKEYSTKFPKWKSEGLAGFMKEESCDELALDLLSRMLRLDPCKRISAKSALKHPYFDEIKD